MFWRCVILLLCPTLAAASCGTHRLQYYDLLIHENRYSKALRLVLTDLDASPAEQRAFKIQAIADDEGENSFSISPATLQTGKSAACQQAIGALVNARDRRKDREKLAAYHQDWIAARTGWTGCEIDGKKLDQPEEAAKTAYQCLEDPSLEAHQAALEIHVLLAKASAGDVHRLSDEDSDLLQQQLNLFNDGASVFNDKTTNSYYLPSIKHADQQSFCRGVAYAWGTLRLRSEEMTTWHQDCQTIVQGPKSKI
jgi:hypothetical protein